MKTRPKYSSFADFMRGKRGEKYRSAREFCTRVKLEVSYPQYSRYEAGEQLPSLAQALTIAEVLEIPPLEMTLEWNLTQVEDSKAQAELRKLLQTIRDGGVRPKPAPAVPVPLDEVIVFNRSHRDLFMKDPAYRDIFTYVNAFGNFEETTLESISKALKIPEKKLSAMLQNLVNLGVIHEEKRRYKASKANFYFPDDADFFELRQSNIRHNFEQVLSAITYPDLAEKRALRGLLTRELTASQLGWVMGQVEALLSSVVELPEDPQAQTIYSLCAVVGQRFSR